jgi:HEAT repeat protein
VAQLIPVIQEGGGEHVHSLLEPFGEAAVDGLMEMLAKEEDKARRATLVSTLVQLSKGHPKSVAARLSDSRWFVVRNAVTVLYRAHGSEVLPYLVEASRHMHPAVRREVIRGLVAVGGEEAVPVLRRLAADSDHEVRRSALEALGGMVVPAAAPALAGIAESSTDLGEKRRAIDYLGRHPAREATMLLEALASGEGSAKVPLALRRHAKDLLKVRRGAGW